MTGHPIAFGYGLFAGACGCGARCHSTSIRSSAGFELVRTDSLGAWNAFADGGEGGTMVRSACSETCARSDISRTAACDASLVDVHAPTGPCIVCMKPYVSRFLMPRTARGPIYVRPDGCGWVNVRFVSGMPMISGVCTWECVKSLFRLTPIT